MKKISIIVHGRHGLNPLLQDFIDNNSQTSGLEIQLRLTKKNGDAKQFAKDACLLKHEIIIAAGGDGTINEVVNGMFDSAESKPHLLIIPIGTGNDFMLNRKVFTNPNQITAAIHSTQRTSLDVGAIHEVDKKHYFLNIADIGFGGATVHTLNKQRKYLGGKISYPIAILRTFFSYRKPTITFESSNFNYKGKALMIAFCNSESFGSGIKIHPGADPSDQILNVTFLGQVSLFDYIRYLPKLKKGIRIDHPELHYFTANEARMTLLQGCAPIEADGEAVNFTNATISLIPSAIQLIEPLN